MRAALSRSHLTHAFAAIALVAFAAACTDSATAPAGPNGLAFAIVDVNEPALEGNAVLCKETDPSGSLQTFSFNVSINGVPNLAPTVLSDGQCVTLATSTKGAGEGTDQIDITEVAPPANWAVTDILIERMHVLSGGTADAFNVAARTATVFINIDLGRRVTYTNTFTPPTGDEGCTPGYWKQPHHFDSWVGYTQNQSFNTVFGIGTAWFPNSFTLLDALNANGGGKNALARHAVAALLNAAQGFYPLTEAQVIAAVQGAYPSGDIEGVKDDFEDDNELGCPLN